MYLDNQKIFHPLFAYTLAFTVGIIAPYLQIPFAIILLIITSAICGYVVCYIQSWGNKHSVKLGMLILFFIAGACRFYLSEKQTNRITEMLKTKSNYTAQVLDISAYSNPFFKHKVLLQITSSDQTQCKIYVYMPNLCGIRIADQLEVIDLKINPPKTNQGSLYSNESLIPKVFANKLLFSLIYRPKFSLTRILKEGKYNLVQNLTRKMSAATSTLFEYIFLGLKNPSDVSDQFRYKFNYWGIAHYLARSGLHVVLIIFLWSLFLRFIPLGFMLKQILLTALSIIYSLLSWPSTSFERALVTFLLVQICLIMKLPIRSSYLIILCSLLFLIVNPFQLFFLDFQLSFGLTLGISVFNEMQNIKG